MKDKLNVIKNKIYEAEGLLELLSLREEKAPDLLPMILSKVDEARALLSSLSARPSDIRDVPEVSEPTVASEKSQVSQPAFCIGDRFRFRRSLFGGSDTEFNGVMDHIATLSNFEEAEEYVYGELGFEPEDEDVSDFMEIIRNYFGT